MELSLKYPVQSTLDSKKIIAKIFLEHTYKFNNRTIIKIHSSIHFRKKNNNPKKYLPSIEVGGIIGNLRISAKSCPNQALSSSPTLMSLLALKYNCPAFTTTSKFCSSGLRAGNI